MSDENSLSQKAATLTTVSLALRQILTGRKQVHCDARRKREQWNSSSVLQKVERYNECDTLTGHLTLEGKGNYGAHPQCCRKWGDIMNVTHSRGI